MSDVLRLGDTPILRRLWPAIEVTLRALAATAGNYALTSLATAAIARLLPMRAAEASMTATLLSFIIFALIAMWVFAARSVMRVYVCLLGWSAILSLTLWLSLDAGGRL